MSQPSIEHRAPFPFALNRVTRGDCLALVEALPDESVDVVVTSPPYWGQRSSAGIGAEADPRQYLAALEHLFTALLPRLREDGIVWINVGDAYNTPVNWRREDHRFSSLGPQQSGLSPHNSAYTKPRHRRKAFLSEDEGWLGYGNLLALPYRLVTRLCDAGYLFRGEVVWRKKNAMPEGRCRRPHRQHECVYLLARSERHRFRRTPPVRSVWELPSERIDGLAHRSRFPLELPLRCIDAWGAPPAEPAATVVLDPFAGSGTTGLAALERGCSFVGFEIDAEQAAAANARLAAAERDRGTA